MRLCQMITELKSIIEDLENIAQDIEVNNRGIGEKDCAKSLRGTARLYRKKLSIMNNGLSKANMFSEGGTGAFGYGDGGGGFRE